jgi:signal transduction histidine kinase
MAGGVANGTQRERRMRRWVGLEPAQLRGVRRVMRRALEAGVELAGSEAGLVELIDRGRPSFDLTLTRGFDGSEVSKRLHPEGPLPEVAAIVLAEGRPVRSSDPPPAPRPPWPPPVATVSSFVGAPLRLHGAVIGVVALANRPGGYGREHLRLISLLADQVVTAIENERLRARRRRTLSDLREATRQRRREQERRLLAMARERSIDTLLRISTRLTSTLDVDELLRHMAKESVALVEARGGFACVRGAEGLTATDYCRGDSWLPLERTFHEGEGLPGHVLATRRQYVTEDAARDPHVDPELRRRFGFHYVICTPILDRRGSVVGFIEVHDRKDGSAFTPSDAEALAALAQAASIAVENALAYQQVTRAEQARLQIFEKLVSAHEEERRRIAEGIHDDSLQVLAVAILRLEMLLQRSPDPAAASQLAELRDLVVDAESRLRNLLFDLRPASIEAPDGLRWALQEYLERMPQDVGLTWELDVSLTTDPPVRTRLVVYRLAVEAITNVIKHARASHLRVQVAEREGGVLGQVEDDGRGFEPAAPQPGHLGLTEMQERAQLAGGWLQIESRPQGGTALRYWIPFPATPW